MPKKTNLIFIALAAIMFTSCFELFPPDDEYTSLYVVLENNTANLECVGDSTDVNITVSNPKAATAKSVTVLVPNKMEKYVQIEVKYGEQISVKVTAADDSTRVLDSKILTVKHVRGWNDPPSPRIGYCKAKGIITEFLE